MRGSVKTLEKTSGWVFDVQRFSLHDGPGIRTTIFMKGCPMRCIWCHNPEGISFKPQVRVNFNLCTLCGKCMDACGSGCHIVDEDKHMLDLNACTLCGKCASVCLTKAAEIVGKKMTAEEVMGIARKDMPFYEQSGGGITLSGGEPMAQAEFALAIMEMARAEKIHTAAETSLCADWRIVERFAETADLLLVDLKHTDESLHKKLTGISNRRILSNFQRLAQTAKPVIIRICLVPGFNADKSFIEKLSELISCFERKPEVEIMPYHRLGIHKWKAIGEKPPISEEIPAAGKDDALEWVQKLQEAGVSVRV